MAFNTKNTLTVASVGVSPLAVNVTIISESEPEFRDNGGDLVQGDRWFNVTSSTESIYVDGAWTPIL